MKRITLLNFSSIFALVVAIFVLVPGLILGTFEANAQNLVPAKGTNTVTATSISIFDPGGANQNYSNNSNTIITILPAFSGGKVSLEFSKYDLDCEGDYIYVYEGVSTDAPLHSILSCKTPGKITASAWNLSGAITIHFVSDDMFTAGGFEATANTVCGAGMVQTSDHYVAEGKTARLNYQGELNGPIQWQMSEDGINWDDISGTNGISLISPPLNTRTLFRVKSFCETGDPAISTLASVEVTKITVNLEKNSKSDEANPFTLTCNNPCAQPPYSLSSIANPSTICVGQTTQLTATASATTFFDNFTGNQVNCNLWDCTRNTGQIDTRCSAPPPPASGGNTLYFRNVDNQNLRQVQTQNVNTQDGGSISFWIILGANSNGCESPDICGSEEVYLEYSNNGPNGPWVIMFTFRIDQGQYACNNNNGNPVDPNNHPNPWRGNWVFMDVPIPPAARTPGTRFRFRQNLNSGNDFDNWALDDVRINVGTFNYQWEPPQTLNDPNISNPTATPTTTTTYTVMATSTIGGCCMLSQVTVTVTPSTPGVVSTAQTICSGTSPVALTLSGNNGPVIRWEQASDCNQTFNNVGNAGNTTYSPGVLFANNCYRAVTRPAGCSDVFTNCVCITVNQPPAQPNATPNPINLCQNQSGGVVNVQNPINGVTYNWYTVPNNGTPIQTGTTFNVPPPNQAMVYYLEAVQNGCTSSRRPINVLITNISPASVPTGNYCRGQNGAQLCVQSPIPGETYNWYNQQNGGTLLGSGSCFNNNGTIANTNGTFSYYVERVANGCTATRSVGIINISTPAGPAVTNQFPCTGKPNVQICVTSPQPGTTYNWYNQPSGGTLLGAGNCLPVLTNTPGVTTYYVESISQGCTSSRTFGTVSVSNLPSPVVGNNGDVCPGEAGGVYATAPTDVLFYVYDAQTGGNLLSDPGGITFNTVFNTAPINVNPTCFYFEARKDGCVSPRSQTCIYFNPNTPQKPTPTFTDSIVCQEGFIQIAVAAPNNGTLFTWKKDNTVIGMPNASYPAMQSIDLTTLPVGTHYYTVTANQGNCIGPPDTVTITISPPAVPGNVSGPADVCSGSPVDLTLNGYDGYVLFWQRNVDNGGYVNIPGTGPTITDNNVTQPTCYRAFVGPCSGNFSMEWCVAVNNNVLDPGNAEVQLTAGPPATWARIRTACGNFTPTIRLTNQNGTVVRWEASDSGENGPYTITVTDLSLTTINSTLGNTTQRCFRAIVSSAGCGEAPSTPACVNIDALDPGILSLSDTICTGGNFVVNLTGTVGDIQRWQSTSNINNGNCIWSGNGFVNPIIPAAQNPTYASTLTQTTCFRVIVQSKLFPDQARCPDAISNEVKITVNEPSVGGTTGSPTTVCDGSTANLTLAGNLGTVLYWEQANDFDFTQNVTPPLPGTAGQSNITTPILSAGGNSLYCFRAAVQNEPCPRTYSSVTCITVNELSVAGVASAAQTVCTGTFAQPLTLTGYLGTIQRWEKQVGVGNYTSIPGSQNLTTLDANRMGIITTTTCFRAFVKNGVCPEVQSNEICINIDALSVGGTLGDSQTICRGDNANALTLVGFNGTILYWEAATTQAFNAPIRTITNTLDSYTPVAMAADSCYRAVVKNASCLPAYSNVICIKTDAPAVGGTVRQDGYTCQYGTYRFNLTGRSGTVQRWQFADDINFNVPTDVAVTRDSLRTPALDIPGQRCYRAVIKNGVCPEVFSAPACVTITEQPIGGILSQDQTICAGQQANNLVLTGYTSRVALWQKSTNNFVTRDTLNVQVDNLDPGILTQTTCFRAQVNNGTHRECNNTTSNIVCITVDAAVDPGVLASDQTVCPNETVNLTLTGQTGTIDQWEASTDNTFPQALTTLTNTNAANLTSAPITAKTYFRVRSSAGACPNVYSNTVTIDVHPSPVAGTLSSDQTVCGDGQPLNPAVNLTLTGSSGDIVRWESETSVAFNSPTDIGNAGNTTFTVPAQTPPGLCYRAVIKTTGANCQTLFSNGVCITANDPTVAGTITPGTGTVCTGQTIGTLTLNGSTGNILYWEASNDFTNINEPVTTINSTTTTISAPTQSVKRCYRAVVKSGVCPQKNSPDICIDVFPSVNPGVVSMDQTVCETGTVVDLTLSGQQGNILRWEASSDNSFTTIITLPANVTTIQTVATPVNRCYRAVIQAGGQCPEVGSVPACITVTPRSLGGNVTSDVTTVCVLTNTVNLTLANHRTDVVRWESATDRNFTQNLTTLNGGTGQTSMVVNPTTFTCYRAWVQNGVCPMVKSDTVCINVDQESQKGTMTLGGPKQVCTGSTAGPVTLANAVTDILNWEMTIDNGVTYSPINNNTTSLNTTPTLNIPAGGKACFRATVQNGICPSVKTDTVCVMVDATSIVGNVTAPAIICSGGNGTLTLEGNNGRVIRWESSLDQVTTTAIANISSTNNYSLLTTTTHFRAVTQNGVCPIANSNWVTITVDQPSVAGTITGVNAVCAGDATVRTLTLNGSFGAVQNWESQPNCSGAYVPNSPVNQTTSNNYSSLPVTTCFRAIVKNGSCPAETTAVFKVDVTPESVGGITSPAHTICLGETSQEITLSGKTGDIIRWESSLDQNFTSGVQTISSTVNPIVVTGLTTTRYIRAIVKSGGCPEKPSESVLVTVIQQADPGKVTQNHVICFGSNTNQLTLINSVGTVIRWEKATNLNGPWTSITNTQNVYTENNLTVTSYFRAVLEPQGGNGQCGERFSEPATVTVDPKSVADGLTSPQTLCVSNTSGTLNLGTIVGTVVKWESSTDQNTWTQTGGLTTTHNYSGLTTTTYFRVIAKSGVCPPDTSNVVKIQVDAAPTTSQAGTLAPICSSTTSVTANANTPLVGTGLWTIVTKPNGAPDPTFTPNNSPTATIGNLKAGMYAFAWTISNGVCPSSSSTVSLRVDQEVSQPSITGIQPVCVNSTIQLNASANIPDSSTGIWTVTGPATPAFSNSTVVNPTVTGLTTAGTYTFTWTVRNGNVCPSKSANVVVTVDPLTITGTVTADETLCFGSNKTLNLAGNNGQVVRWESSANSNFVPTTTINSTTNQITVNNIQTSTYYRAVIKSGTCPEMPSNSIRVTIDPTTVAGTLNGPATVCKNGNSGAITLSGHVGTVVRWEKSLNQSSGYTPIVNTTVLQTYSNLTQTTYYRAVVKSGVCLEATTPSVEIKVVKPEYTNTKADIRCFGEKNGSITLSNPTGGEGAYRYTWSNGATTQNLTGLGKGTYCVTVFDGINCPTDICIEITEPTKLEATFDNMKQVSCFGVGDGLINISVTGATLPYSYAWVKDGQPFGSPTTQDLSGLVPGTYSVTITDGNGCLANLGPYVISQPNEIISTTSYINHVTCNGMLNGAIGHNVSGGNPPYTYLWTNGRTEEDLENLAAGSYTVTITDAIGCKLIKTFVVTQPNVLAINLTQIKNPSCAGSNSGSIGVDVVGGTQPYIYQWSSGDRSEDLLNKGSGTYELVVRDNKNCMVRKTFTLTDPEAIKGVVSVVTPIKCAGSSTGALKVVASGGASPYIYKWSNGSTTEEAIGLSAGGHNVTIKDANGCIVTVAYELKEPEAIRIVTWKVDDVSCKGGSNGKISMTILGGTGVYTYVWSDGITTQDRKDLIKGVYTITIKDTDNCQLVKTFTVSEPDQSLSVTEISRKEVTCGNSNDGMIDVDVQGGTPPYSYQWSSGELTQDLNNIQGGSYTIAVTDKNGCVAGLTVVLSKPDPLAYTLNFKVNPKCFGGKDGSIGYNISGGVPPYSYLWNTGRTREDIKDVEAGVYTLNVTDARGCKLSITETLTAPPALVLSLLNSKNPKCFDSQDGSANVKVTGGTAPYSYKWSDGSTGSMLSNAGSGEYVLMVTDQNGCMSNMTVSLIAPAAIKITNVVKRNVSCNGGNDGALVNNVTGGTSPLRFTWKLNNAVVSNSIMLSTGKAGIYVFEVTDANGCKATRVDTIKEPTVLAATVATINNLCNGGLKGEVEVTATGGTAPYSYSWSNGGSASKLINLVSGTYVVTVTDSKGCSITTQGIISEPVAMVLSITKEDVKCFGANSGSLKVGVTGGVSPYSYIWSNGGTTQEIGNLSAGVYSVTVRDANGCNKTMGNLTISEPNKGLKITLSYKNDVRCFGTSNGSIGIDVTGGVEPYSYSWTNGETKEDINNIPAGTYTVTVTDGVHCATTFTTTIGGATEALSYKLDYINHVICNGGNTGSIGIDVSGGTQPYTYLWSNGSVVEDQVNLKAGRYNLTIRDANGCLKTGAFEIFEPTPIIIESEVIAANCSGTGKAVLTVTGGVEPYTYQWSNGNTGKDLEGVDAGNYIVQITDGSGCKISQTITIPLGTALKAKINILQPILCSGGKSGGASLDLEITGGTAPYTYLWSTSETVEDIFNVPSGPVSVEVIDAMGCKANASLTLTAPKELLVVLGSQVNVRCNSGSNGSLIMNVSGGVSPYSYAWSNGKTSKDITGLSSGDYTLTVTDKNGCSVSSSYTITEPSKLVVSEVFNVPVACGGGSTGRLGVNATGGVDPYSYVWSYQGVTESELKDIPAGSYTVTVTDKNGCRSVKTFALGESSVLSIKLNKTISPNCNGGKNGLIDIDVTGGTLPYIYSWTTGVVTQDISNIGEGEYDVIVTDKNGCSATMKFTLTPVSNVSGKISGLPAEVCFGSGPITMSGTPLGGTFSGPGVTGRIFDPSNLSAGTYSIVYSGVQSGCNYSVTASVKVLAKPGANSITIGGGSVTTFCSSDTKTYLLSVTPLENGTTVVMSGRGISKNGNSYRFVPSSAGTGTFTLTAIVTNSKGCVKTITQTVTINSPSALTVSATNDRVCLGSNTTLTAVGAESYVWSPVTGLDKSTGSVVIATPLRTTTYTVTGTTGSCKVSKTIRIVVASTPKIVMSSLPSAPVCAGIPVNLKANSSGNYSYVWSPVDGLNVSEGSNVTATPNKTTTYTITGTTPEGCTNSATVSVIILPSTVSISASATDLCTGNASILTASSSESGNFTYTWSPSEGLNSNAGEEVIATPNRTITYTVTRSGGNNVSCQTATVTIHVRGSLNGGITGLNALYCVTSGSATMAGTPLGGQFSGPGVSGSIFDPSIAGSGIHTIMYSGMDKQSGCTFSYTKVVEVKLRSEGVILNLKPEYCIIAPSETLVGSPNGGVMTINGVRTNILNPGQLGEGTFEVKYSGTEPNGCSYEVLKQIVVRNTEVVFGNFVTTLCQNSTPIVLSATPLGGVFSGRGVVSGPNGYSFNPSISGLGTFDLVYSGIDGPCTYSKTVTVRVVSGVNASATATGVSCLSCTDGVISITASGGQPLYQYRLGNGGYQNASVFNGLGMGSYVITVRDQSGCETSVTATVGQGSGSVCEKVQISNITPEAMAARVSWLSVPSASNYQLAWRVKGTNGPFRTATVVGTTFRLTNLSKTTEYEIKVRARCDNGFGEFSELAFFKTLSGREMVEEIVTSMGVYPNPTKGSFVLNFNSEIETLGKVEILDVTGRLVYEHKMTVLEGANSLSVELIQPSSGVYQVRTTIGNEIKTIKLVVE